MAKAMTGKRRARNRNLPAGLYKLPNGSFYTRHPMTRKAVYYGTTNESEAKAIHAPVWLQWQQDRINSKATAIVENTRAAADPRGSETFAGFCTRFRQDVLPALLKRDGKPLSMKTRADYDRMLRNQVEPWKGFDSRLKALTVDDFRSFLSQWIGSPNFYNYARALLIRVVDHAVDTGRLSLNPVRDITKRPVGKRDALITDDEYLRITGQLDEAVARACDLLYLVSHNPVDVLGLREDQILAGSRQDNGRDRPTIEIRFERQKTHVAVELWDWADSDLWQLIDWFRQRKRAQGMIGPHLVVYGTDSKRSLIGKPFSVGYVSKHFSAAVVAAGLPKGQYTLRDLRPKGLTDDFRIGGDSDKGGHKTDQMKRHYRRGLPMRAKNNLSLLREKNA